VFIKWTQKKIGRSVGVGKSSLIRRYTERCFLDNVPGLLSTIRLPQSEALFGSYEMSITDSQRGDISLLKTVATKRSMVPNVLLFPAEIPSALTSIVMTVQEELDSVEETGESVWNECKELSIIDVDSIILVYDSNRIDTLERLECHWLPLIEYCFNGKVRFRNCC
jgi:GTPase SAR1 family protein